MHDVSAQSLYIPDKEPFISAKAPSVEQGFVEMFHCDVACRQQVDMRVYYRALLLENRALLLEHRAFLLEYRALLLEYRAPPKSPLSLPKSLLSNKGLLQHCKTHMLI